MDPVSALASVAGLVASLETILRTLEKLSYNLASRKLGVVTLDENPLRNLRRIFLSLNNILSHQSSLHPDLKHAQVNELLQSLQVIENELDTLQKVIQNAKVYRKIRLFRRALWKRDTDDAATSILLAKNVIHMIRLIQELGHRENIPLARIRSHNKASLEYLNSALNPTHYQPLLKAPSTKAQEVFARIVGPEGQEKLHEQCRAERIAGTCEWFLERREFQSWVQRPSRTGDDAILWCQGRPGIGKTMLASKVIDQLQPLHVVAYFYMGSAKSHSASDVVTSLLKQLCLPLHIVPARLQQIFEQTNGEHGYRLELKDSLEALREAFHSIHQPVTIIIDGLDETNIRERSDFVQVFKSLKGTPQNCLITSRGTQYVLPKAYDSFSEFVIEDDANGNDIYNFVKCVLEENEPVDRMLKGDEKLRLEVLKTLTSRSHGMFFWVTLQVRHILDQTHLSGIRDALQSIPKDICGIVDSTLRMVKLQDENRAKLAYRALALLTAAAAPLTAEAMCHALGLMHILDYQKRPSKLRLEEIPNPESIIECCMGLIKIEPTTRVVTLAHYDILQEMGERWTEIFGPDQTARLAETCIAYLLLADFSGGPCHVISTLRERLEEHPFLEYASRYWGYHARQALLLPVCQAHVKDNIHWFLKQPMNLALSLQVSNYDPEGKQRPLNIDSDSFLGLCGLQIASRHGLAAVVEDFLSTDPNIISFSDRNGRTALHEAAQAGWEDIVSMLIENGADPSMMDDEDKTPFFYAAECGHAGVISILERHYVDGDHHQQQLQEALCDAADAGKTTVVKELLDLNVNPDAKKSGITAMTAASLKGHKQIVRLLWKKGASVDGGPSDSIPLHQAIKSGHVETAALLLDLGANIQTCDRLNRTALFETLGTSDTRGAALLLKNGIDISCPDSMGNTVLHEAARRGSVEHAVRFVDRGVDVTIPNKEGLTPLHLAARHGHLELADLLLQKGATVDARDSTGYTPLMLAASAGNTHLCKILLDSGAYIHEVKVGQRTPLYPAEGTIHHQNQKSPVDIMPEQGTDPIEHNSTSKTSHTLAVEAETTAVPESSITRGAVMDHLKTALLCAAEAGHAEIQKLLLEYGAEFDSTNEEDRAREMLLQARASKKDYTEENR